MTINFSSKCKACKENKIAESWMEIGTQVHISGGEGGDTNHTLYQCMICGSAWIKIQKQGCGDENGTYYHSLTEPFY